MIRIREPITPTELAAADGSLEEIEAAIAELTRALEDALDEQRRAAWA